MAENRVPKRPKPPEQQSSESDAQFLARMFGLVAKMSFAPGDDQEAIEGWKIGAETQLSMIGRARFERGVKLWLANQTNFPWPAHIAAQTPDEAPKGLSQIHEYERAFADEAKAAGMTPHAYRKHLAGEFDSAVKKSGILHRG